MTSPSPDGSGIDLVLGCRHYYQSVGTESFWVALDAQTGTSDQLIDYDVPTLEPWHSEPVPAWLWSLIQTGDYDGDGFIDREEWNGSEAVFNALDRDNNGRISLEEMAAGLGAPYHEVE